MLEENNHPFINELLGISIESVEGYEDSPISDDPLLNQIKGLSDAARKSPHYKLVGYPSYNHDIIVSSGLIKSEDLNHIQQIEVVFCQYYEDDQLEVQVFTKIGDQWVRTLFRPAASNGLLEQTDETNIPCGSFQEWFEIKFKPHELPTRRVETDKNILLQGAKKQIIVDELIIKGPISAMRTGSEDSPASFLLIPFHN